MSRYQMAVEEFLQEKGFPVFYLDRGIGVSGCESFGYRIFLRTGPEAEFTREIANYQRFKGALGVDAIR